MDKYLYGLCKTDEKIHIKQLHNNHVIVLCDIECAKEIEEIGFYDQLDFAKITCEKCKEEFLNINEEITK